MISLVGPASGTEYPLPLVTRELQGALDALYDAGRLSELIDPHAALAAFNSDFPTPPQTDWPRPRLGTIFWPVVGMARYAYACLLVDEYTVGQLRSQMTSTAGNTITIKLRDDPTDGAEAARSIAMQFLASRPLVRTTGASLTGTDNGTDPVDAWVVILVDDRYRTLTQSLTSITTTAWSDVFSSLGVTIGDAVDADYLTPGARWALSRVKGRSIGWLADIAALCVGSRIVKVPGGSPTLQRPTTGNATTLSSAHTAAGTRFFGGGPVETLDVYAGMPNSVRVTFGSPTETTPVVVDSSVQTAYVWPSSAYLSHWCDAPASTSGGNRTALADQWKADWYAWQGAFYDTVYSGFVAAPASGYVWNVVWEHSADVGTTRFVRPPHWYGYLLAPQYGSVPYSLTVQEKDGSPSVTDVTTVQFDQAKYFVVSSPAAAATALVTLNLPGSANQQTVSDGSGGLTAVNQYVVDNGTNRVRQYVIPPGGDPATSPVRQFTVDNSGTPTITQNAFTNGTTGGNGVTETLTPTQFVVTNNIDGAVAYSGFDKSGGLPRHFVVANSDLTNGLSVLPTISGGKITQFVINNTLWNGASAITAGTTYTVSGSTITATVPSGLKWVFGDTVTFASGTANKVAKYSATGVLGDSTITDTGGAVSTSVPFTSVGSAAIQVTSGVGSYIATPAQGASAASLSETVQDTGATVRGTRFFGYTSGDLYEQVSSASLARGHVFFSVVDASGTANGGSGTTGGLTFVGGLYVSGTASVPVSSGVSGLGTGVATFLATPSSANLAAAITDETGTGALVFANTPTLVTPILGTPTSGTLTNCTGYPASALTGTLSASAMPALTGDITSSAGTVATTLSSAVKSGIAALSGAYTYVN